MKTTLFAFWFAISGAEAATELAKINQQVISLEEFNKQYSDSLKFQSVNGPSKQEFLEGMIQRELVIQEAKKRSIEKDPVVAERIRALLYQAMLEQKLSSQIESIKISESDLKSYYNKNPEIRTSHIFVSVRPGASKEEISSARQRANAILAEVKSGKKSFSEIAITKSEGPAAPMGGDIDFQTKDRFDPAYYKAAISLRKGNVSDVVETRFGFHIIKLTDTRSWEQVDRDMVRRMLFEEKRAELQRAYLDELKKANSVSVKTSLLKE